jgi:hypothetical protein
MTIFSKHNLTMDSQQFNKKLAKISHIVDNIDTGSTMSALERDLLLSYIRDLYDIAIDSHHVVKSSPKVTPQVESIAPTPTVQPTPPAPRVVQEVVVEKQIPVVIPEVTEPVIEPVVVAETKAPEAVVAIEIVEVKRPEPTVINPPTLTFGFSMSAQPEAVKELFVEEEIHDLSDKLSITPIKDLTKSMGINERVLMLHELFGNNKEGFTESLERLNGLSNFGEATQYMIEHIIPKYDWTADKRIKTATQFIKLVRRRYT